MLDQLKKQEITFLLRSRMGKVRYFLRFYRRARAESTIIKSSNQSIVSRSGEILESSESMQAIFNGPGPTTYEPTNYEQYLKRVNLRKVTLKKSAIDRLDFTLRLYHPAWESRQIGYHTSELVAPNTYRPKLPRKQFHATFSTEKRFKNPRNLSPSPQAYDTLRGLSMCSS